MRKRNIAKLLTKYNPIGLSQRRKHMAERKERELKLHHSEVLRNLGRWAMNPRYNAVSQLFESKANGSKNKLNIEEPRE